MVRTASLFSQLLTHFPRSQFASLVRQLGAERHSKGFTCWTQFVAMLFCHLARADSLREICNGLACCLGKLGHLGILRAPRRSTLSYANQHRPAALYEKLFWATLQRFRAQQSLGQRKSKFRFKNKLLSLDATVVSLSLSLFPWASLRRTKGGVKLHVLLDHDDYMPRFVHISRNFEHELFVARRLFFSPGTILVLDRAFIKMKLFGSWCRRGVFFVTRMKKNTLYEVVERRRVPSQSNILVDEIIQLTGPHALESCPHLMRRVVAWDPDQGRELVFLTNHLDFGPTTIAAIYKERWQIEIFFKTLKQNLKIKTFVGTSYNALCIQIWTALIALLLLKWLHHLSRARWSFSNLASMLRLNLFTYRDLADWLHDPFRTPPLAPDPVQIPLQLGQLPAANTQGRDLRSWKSTP